MPCKRSVLLETAYLEVSLGQRDRYGGDRRSLQLMSDALTLEHTFLISPLILIWLSVLLAAFYTGSGTLIRSLCTGSSGLSPAGPIPGPGKLSHQACPGTGPGGAHSGAKGQSGRRRNS